MLEIKFKCPKCKEERLRPDEAGLKCTACDLVWPYKDNIADLGGEIPYYGEVTRTRMRAIIEEAKEKGWKKALYDNFYTSYNYLYIIAAYETRADWLYLLDLTREHVVLDVGSGWGTEAVPLARNTGLAVAMDGTLERLEFTMVRAAQEKVDNLIGVRGSILDPPLAGEQFDLVVFNGVLEWMGTADDKTAPDALQKRALRNAFDLLKKGGRLYIGIENSHGFKYLLGEPDDHTSIRNITYLPRDEADKVMQAVAGRNYKTYTYSCPAYKAMLEEAGFSKVDFYYPIADYKIFTHIAPLDRMEPYRYYLQNLGSESIPGTMTQNVRNLERFALESDTLKDHVASYGIIAEKI